MLPRPSCRPLLLSTAAVVSLAGCTLGPDPHRPQVGFPLDTPFARSLTVEATTRPAEAEVTWWRGLGDPTSARLVEAALAGNLDLAASAARVRQATAVARQARGARLPSVSAGFTASGRGTSDTASANLGPGGGDPSFSVGGDDFIETYDLSGTVAWQADLFGRLRRLEQSAELGVVATRADRLAIAHSVVAQAIRSRIAIGTLDIRLALAQQNLASLRETLELVQARYEAGIGAAVDLRLARENVATAEAQIPPIKAQRDRQVHGLSVLLGRRVTQVPAVTGRYPVLPELAPPPTRLPIALLDRRPDLLASEFRARARQAEIGAAVADLFPNVTLSVGGGLTSGDLGDLLDPDSFVYSIVGSVTQPIFQGGQLRARVDQAEAAADEAAATYANLILRAIAEVNDAMVTEASTRAQVEANARALVEAEAAEALARNRFATGLGDLLSVFEAERRRRAAEERLALSRQGVWDARINLHLALGGDWELNLPPAAAVEPFARDDTGRTRQEPSR
jgi:NodT family efflux transporter outer membrane factor (OMF) lipoprotein